MSANGDRVVVIVPNFNKEKVLRACLESVFAQTHPPVEVVVVDDCSTDSSRQIAAEFPCRLVTTPVNQGPAAARNTGVTASTAPLLFFVDSDTALAPDAIANAVRILHQDPDIAMVQGIYAPEPLIDDGPVEAYRVAFEHYWRRRSVGRDTGTLFAASLIRRTVFVETGGFDERLRDGEDDEFGTRLPARYRLVTTDQVLTRHDDVDRLAPLLREQLVRAATKPSLMVRTWLRQRTGAAGTRVEMMAPGRFRHLEPSARMSLLTSALTLATLPLVIVQPWLVLAWPVLGAGFALANREFLRLAHRLRGPGFALLAAGLHGLVQVTLVAGLVAGLPRAAGVLLSVRSDPADPAPPTQRTTGPTPPTQRTAGPDVSDPRWVETRR